MGVGEPELGAYLRWDPSGPGEPPRIAAADLVTGLTSTGSMVKRALTRWTVGDMAENVAAPGVLSKEEQEIYGDATREWMIWHVLEHEIHHGGKFHWFLVSMDCREYMVRHN